jgi:hypothetical protein
MFENVLEISKKYHFFAFQTIHKTACYILIA